MGALKEKPNIEDYLSLDYTTEVRFDPVDKIYVAKIKELKDCMSHGETIQEAFEEIEVAKRLWIETAIDHGFEIPKPKNEEDYSGKFIVRVPKNIHKEITEKAEENGVSLNQWVLSVLAKNI
jgi:predicted RNase H-like HicB family nuclease